LIALAYFESSALWQSAEGTSSSSPCLLTTLLIAIGLQ